MLHETVSPLSMKIYKHAFFGDYVSTDIKEKIPAVS